MTSWPAPRRHTRAIRLGNVNVGGNAPVSVQTMAKTDTRDIESTVAQINAAAQIGCDIARVAVPDMQAALSLRTITESVGIPVVADIHFDYRLAVASAEAGCAGLRINPGNIGARENVERVIGAARAAKIPIRIGVNAGSLEGDLRRQYGAGTATALVESAMRHVAMIESAGFEDIKISVKASDVPRTVEAYRMLAGRTDYPLHIGVTEAGTFLRGTVSSSVALGILLSEGIGDTVRVSLTDTPENEVRVGLALLRCLGLREPGPDIVSCPSCGRAMVDLRTLALTVEDRLEALCRECPAASVPRIAVMGCMVNGPGEAKEADIALAGGAGKLALYVRGEHVATIPESEAVDELVKRVREWSARRD